MSKKVLYIATSDIHITTFHNPYLKWLSENNCEVHLAVENRGNLQIPHVDQFFYLPFSRSPFKLTNFSTYKKLKKIINTNNYDLIHCHTPIPGVLARLAAIKARRKGTKVLYTSHGFHFYKGGPLKYWLTFYPIEWWLSAFTDGIITINAEDYGYINGKMRHKNSFYIKGIGVNTDKFKLRTKAERLKIRLTYGYTEKEFILVYIAEFIHRKNHQFIIDSIPEIVKKTPHLKVLFVGKGVLMDKMKLLAAKLGIEKYIDFLGFRTDVGKLATIADVGISSSRQEGLGLGLAEEMLCSVPIVASEDRGHREMIIHGKNGFMFKQGNHNEFVEYILKLYNKPALREEMGKASRERAKLFTIEKSVNSMAEIFNYYLSTK